MPDYVLYHHGVKGQKWGVRRYQNKDGSLTPAGKKRYNPDYKSEEREDGSYVIKKGSKVHRVSTSTTTDREGYAYISFMDEDVKGYRKEITEWMNNENPGVKTYDLTMKVTEDLILPSEVEKVKTFIELVENEKIDNMSIMKLKEDYDDYTSDNKAVGRLHDVVDSLMLQGMHADLAMSYACFSLSLFNDSTYKEAFFEALKSKGYNAIEDIEDSFSHRMKPVIVFERENTLKVTNITELPSPDVNSEAWNKIVEEAKAAERPTYKYHLQKGVKY